MKKVKVYGSSDDLIEIEGDIYEEFNHYTEDDEKGYLAFSDGTVLSIVYDGDGIWRFNRVAKGTAKFTKKEPEGEEYSDVITLEGVEWVVFGKGFKK